MAWYPSSLFGAIREIRVFPVSEMFKRLLLRSDGLASFVIRPLAVSFAVIRDSDGLSRKVMSLSSRVVIGLPWASKARITRHCCSVSPWIARRGRNSRITASRARISAIGKESSNGRSEILTEIPRLGWCSEGCRFLVPILRLCPRALAIAADLDALPPQLASL